jgi:penicillin-binding protein 2
MKIDYRERKEYRDYHHERRLGKRLSLIKNITLFILVLFLLDFWFLQIIKGKEYTRQAENNYQKSIVLKPDRGLIKDRFGKILATSIPSFNIAIRRENKPDITESIGTVSKMLKMSKEDLIERWKEMKHRPETEPFIVKEDADFKDMAYVEARLSEDSEILVQEESKRSYSGKESAHILGYIGEASEKEINGRDLNVGDILGKAGIEKRFDEFLRGSKGNQLIEVDSFGRKIRNVPFYYTAPIPGKELRLTVDRRLQKKLYEAFQGEIGAAVFMNPDDGAIYALYSSPTYDPNDFAGHLTFEKWKDYISHSDHPLLNRVTQAVYPPGSTFKVLVAITALEKGLINERTQYYCSGSKVIYNRRLYCWHRGGHGFVNLRKALVHSCNIYFYNLGKILDIDDIRRCAEKFGLGKATGIDLDYELVGLIPNKAWKQKQHGEEWYPGETVSVSIGQGPILVTPLQMARFISLVANGGVKIQPHINQDPRKPTPGSFIGVNRHILAIIKRALWGVVNEKGTGWRSEIEGKNICGKTGTAQISAATALKDSKKLPKREREHAWFIGFAPRDNPEIAFAIIVEHGGYGGEAAAPIAREVLKVYFGDTGEDRNLNENKEEESIERASLPDHDEKTVWQN